MSVLDNTQGYGKYDTSGMINHLRQFPDQFRRAWEKANSFELPATYTGIDKVIICGMGGSAIGGDMGRRLALKESSIPVWVNRNYELPPFVDKNTLLIASSYSGNTEETIAAFNEALKTPAKKLVLTTGGKLKDTAEQNNIPAYIIDYPSPPRAAFPHSFVPLVVIFQKLGILGDKSGDLQESIDILDKLGADFAETKPLISNHPKQLAAKIYGQIAVIYSGGILSEVARRWKTQLNENSKNLALYDLFPELNHNAATGYDYPLSAKASIFVCLLRSPLLHPRTRLRYEATAKLLDELNINYEILDASGESIMAQMMSLVLLGDYLSYYLAILNKVDPTPVAPIDSVKKYLARFPDYNSPGKT